MAIKYRKLSQNLGAINSGSTFHAKFKSSGSEDLTVDGSVTPVTFTLEDIPVGSTFLLERVTFVIGADEVLDLNKFGNLDALVNGLTFEANVNTAGEEAVATIKDNADTMLISSNISQHTAGVGATAITSLYGAWDFTETYGGNVPIIKDNDLSIVIHDDLSLMNYFKVSCHGILLEDN